MPLPEDPKVLAIRAFDQIQYQNVTDRNSKKYRVVSMLTRNNDQTFCTSVTSPANFLGPHTV